jgi:hypothetical protein
MGKEETYRLTKLLLAPARSTHGEHPWTHGHTFRNLEQAGAEDQRRGEHG